MSLVGKRILILGGNGFLGNYFASRFVQQKAIVSCLSRSSTKYNYPENQSINWIRGSILEPADLKKEINSHDVIIHTIGTLFDTSVTKRTKPGGVGTYEQVNRDTMASLLGVLDKQKRIIYISSAGSPPFLPRYLSTKYQAEIMLFATNHEGYTLRPGFIFDRKHRWWSIPVKWEISIWNMIDKGLLNVIPEKTSVHRILKEFKQGESVALDDLTNSVLELSLNGSELKINEVPDILKLSLKYKNQNKH